jgi:hypothetical protein
MACNECGYKRGHMNGCSQFTATPVDSQLLARKKNKNKKCPPHNWVKLATYRDLDGSKVRTDFCANGDCDAKHTYRV